MNKLINETSPYLLQHAHNPVDWYPWGDEALNKAKAENKPILVSIGYAACHWCHVMERESFENKETAALMNEHFVNIKIDREERPDLDHIYMDAVQAMTGSGGWPLNVFLTPEAKPFFGGTYFPPIKAFNRSSWTEVLQGIAQAFTERREEINSQAENLTSHLFQANSFGMQAGGAAEELFNWERINDACDQVLKAADKEEGGFGNAPKFPQTFTIQFLLRYYYNSKHVEHLSLGNDALQQALLSLDKMIAGGIYDQAGGGFARYSTDAEWLAPHFEKMLYDNALLLMVIAEAYQLTGIERYKEVIEETMSFVQRELMHSSKGFYSALDADSEGKEGKFYVWQQREVEELMGNDASLFCKYYDVTNQGNWEGENILRVKQPLEEFAKNSSISIDALKALLDKGKKALMKEREERIRPALDDKIILGWNALMNTACSYSFAATGDENYRQLAIDNMSFLLEKFKNESEKQSGSGGEMYHTWKNDQAKYPAFLDDYAFLVQALIKLHEITADVKWLWEAKRITEYVEEHFSDADTGFFFYTNDHQHDVIIRKKEVYDGAVPSGNAMMAYNLYYLSVFFGRDEWKQRSHRMLVSLGKAVVRYPTSFGIWNNLLMEVVAGTNEIAIVGKNALEIHGAVLKELIPYKALMASFKEDNTFPILAFKYSTDPVSIYLCKNYSCRAPVSSTKELMSLINNGGRNI